MSTKKSESKTKPVKNLLNNVVEEMNEEFRKRSIFLQMEAGIPVACIITGFALREQEFKKGMSKVIDMRIQTLDDRTMVASIPAFSGAAFKSAIDLAVAHNVVIKSLVPNGIRPNLKGTYPWISTEIQAVLTPTVFNDKVWIGKVAEIPTEPEEKEVERNLLEELKTEVVVD